jgi:hypothetical protein
MKTAMKLVGWAAVGLSAWMAAMPAHAQNPDPWDQPAAALADQISGILGPGQARFTIRNLSSIPNNSVPAIQALLERDLKAHGISFAGDEGANAIRVTLSEDTRERVWVAEVAEGNTTRVAMVEAGTAVEQHVAAAAGLTLRSQTMLVAREPVLAALEIPGGWIVLEPEQIVLYLRAADGLRAQARIDIGQRRVLPRDPRGLLKASANGTEFDAWLAGIECTGATAPGASPGDWVVNCHASDDPWPIFQDSSASAFYNSARNYFTGVTTPSIGVDLPAFYTAVAVPRPAGGTALLAQSIDSKVQLLENGALKTIAGTRDWGSDFAVLRSGCGSGAQIVTSSSGEASSDSLRAYEVPGLEAVPASAALETGGAVTALWPAPDSRSVVAVVQRAPDQYEVDRVSALCN